MPKKLIQRYIPDPETVKKNKYLAVFARFLSNPNLFHMNRRSVSGAFAVGFFWAMIPIPAEMMGAAISAIILRVNLPISVTLVWMTNPVTIPPIFYFNYLVGTWLIGKPAGVGEFELSLDWITKQLDAIWAPLFTGSIFMGIVLGVLAYTGMRAYWRWYIVRKLKQRQARQKVK